MSPLAAKIKLLTRLFSPTDIGGAESICEGVDIIESSEEAGNDRGAKGRGGRRRSGPLSKDPTQCREALRVGAMENRWGAGCRRPVGRP